MQQQEKHKAKLEGIKKSKSGFGTATQKRKVPILYKSILFFHTVPSLLVSCDKMKEAD